MPDATTSTSTSASPLDQTIREGFTALLALAICGATLTMLVLTFSDARGDATHLAQEKDILLYALSLFGAVIGYYFGRVPAELHASEARAGEIKAVTAKAALTAQVQTTLPKAISLIENAPQRSAAQLTAAGDPSKPDQIGAALSELKALQLRVQS